MVFPPKMGMVRSKCAVILLCSNLTENVTVSLTTLPFVPPFAVSPHSPHASSTDTTPETGHIPASTVVKFPVILADKYLCTESTFSCLLTTINSGYSQSI